MQCSAVKCSAVQCSSVQFSAVQCSSVHCSALQFYLQFYGAVPCSLQNRDVMSRHRGRPIAELLSRGPGSAAVACVAMYCSPLVAAYIYDSEL